MFLSKPDTLDLRFSQKLTMKMAYAVQISVQLGQ